MIAGLDAKPRNINCAAGKNERNSLEAMPPQPKAQRFKEFIIRLRAAPAAVNREDALSLNNKMHVYGWEFEWKDLDANPCYWDDSWAKVHRTQIYDSGRIVITKLREPGGLVLDKPGV